jgi:hypothetical protein
VVHEHLGVRVHADPGAAAVQKAEKSWYALRGDAVRPPRLGRT